MNVWLASSRRSVLLGAGIGAIMPNSMPASNQRPSVFQKRAPKIGGCSFNIISRWEFDCWPPGSADGLYYWPGGLWHKTPISGKRIVKEYDDTNFIVQVTGDILPDPANT